MKNRIDQKDDLLTKLDNLSAILGVTADGPKRAIAVKRLDALIDGLSKLRSVLTAEEFIEKATAVRPAVAQVIEFLASARQDGRLIDLLEINKGTGKATKREPIDILPNLSNQQIRELLKQDLSSKELQSIATQRSISAHGANREDIKRAIVDNLNREEGYQRLASPT